jgi:hypothetical protein
VWNARTGALVYSDSSVMRAGYMYHVLLSDSAGGTVGRLVLADHINTIHNPYHFHNGGTWLISSPAPLVRDSLLLRYDAPFDRFVAHQFPASAIESGLINHGEVTLTLSVPSDTTYGFYTFDVSRGAAEVCTLVRTSDTNLGLRHWNLFDTARRSMSDVAVTPSSAAPGPIRMAHVSRSVPSVTWTIEGRTIQGADDPVGFLGISLTDTGRDGQLVAMHSAQTQEFVAATPVVARSGALTTVFLYDAYIGSQDTGPEALFLGTSMSIAPPPQNNIRLINLTDVVALRAYFVAGPNKGSTDVAIKFGGTEYAKTPWTYQDVYVVDDNSGDTVGTGKIGFDQGVTGSLVVIGSRKEGTIALYRIQDIPEPTRREILPLNPISGVHDPATSAGTIQVSPNPARDNVTVAFPAQMNGRYRADLYTSTGDVVWNRRITAAAGSRGQATIDVSELASGVYHLTVTAADRSGGVFGAPILILR